MYCIIKKIIENYNINIINIIIIIIYRNRIKI